MSASKKKLQRKAEVDTAKVSEAEAKQAAYKKKSRQYSIIAIVVVVLVAALLVWNSGVFQKNATAATIGDEKLTVAELSYYYYNNYYYQLYAQYGIDFSTVVNSETGETVGDTILDYALTDAHEVETLYRDALANGYSDADYAEELSAQIESIKATAASVGYSYKSYLKAAMGKYMTPAVFEKMMTRNLVVSAYYSEVGTEKSESYTSADLDAYYAENADEVDTYTYSYLYFKADTITADSEEGEGLSEEELAAKNEAAMAEAKAKAEAALADYNAGISVTDLIEDVEPSSSVDHNSVTGKSSISAAYSEELLKLGKDEAAVVEYTDYGYYLVVFHEKARNEELTASVYNIFVPASTTTDSNGYYKEPDALGWETAKQEAEELLADWESGKKTAETFSMMATSNGMSNGGLSTGVHSGSSDPEKDGRINWLYNEGERNPGDTIVARYESSTYGYGYYVSYFLEWDEAVWMMNVRNTLANNYLTEWKNGLKEASPAELTSAAKNVG